MKKLDLSSKIKEPKGGVITWVLNFCAKLMTDIFGGRNCSFPGMGKSAGLLSGLLLLLPHVKAVNYNQTLTQKCITVSGGSQSFSFTKANIASGQATLTVYVKGDLASSTEYYEILDENGDTLGQVTATSDCPSTWAKGIISIPRKKINQWNKDRKISFVADASSSVGTFCTNNCVYMSLQYPVVNGPNNAGVTVLDSPVSFCAGSRNIVVRVANLGTNKLNNVKVSWSFNGKFQATLSLNKTLDTLGSGNYETSLKLGNKNFQNGKIDTVRAWTHSPNGKQDTFNRDDTLVAYVLPSLSGTYTIGGTRPDFKSYNDGLKALYAYGVCGPVVFDVRAGTYNENLTVFPLPRDTNYTITFRGRGPDSTTIRSSTSSSVIHLDGASYFIFEDMTIENASYSDELTVFLDFGSNHNRIENCRLKAFANCCDPNLYIYNSDSNYIVGNEITGGYYGIRNYISSDYNHYYRNRISDFDAYAFRIYRSADILVRQNMIGNGQTPYYGIYQYSSNTRFIHNTVSMSPNNDLMYFSLGNTWHYNNNYKHTGTSSGTMFDFNNTGYTMDHNNYDLKGSNMVEDGANTYNDLKTWKKMVVGSNQNSWSQRANLKSSSNLHLDPSRKFLRSFRSFGLSKDIDGDPRCNLAPSLGADESGYPLPRPNANFYVNDTICLKTPVTILSGSNKLSGVQNRWYVNGKLADSSLDLVVSFDQKGYDTIKLVTRNCSGYDSSEKVVYVNPPGAKPQTNFIANKNNIFEFETVELKEVSDNCPSRWKWEIYPDSIFDKSLGGLTNTYVYDPSGKARNVSVTFFYPGVYDVCLTTRNQKGKGKRICMKDYIRVNDKATMCTYPYQTSAMYGVLYDDGGTSDYYDGFPTGARISPDTCTYLINPCASKIILDLEMFDVGSSDYLRIYDGKDATGKKLWDVSTWGAKGFGNSTTLANSSIDSEYVANSGNMYIEWERYGDLSYNGTGGPGFKASWRSVPGFFLPPVAKYDVADTVCPGVPVEFENLSTGRGNRYQWYSGATAGPTASSKDFTFIYFFAGRYRSKLIVKNCGGIDTITKEILVINPGKAPSPGFSASQKRPVINKDVVTLSDNSYPCAESWKWFISPKSWYFVNGTGPSTKNPQVVFEDTGYYSVSLSAGYQGKWDSLKKVNYIYGIDICTPSVMYMISDLGISRVQIGDIDKSSPAGKTAYSDYTATGSTRLDMGQQNIIRVSRKSTINKMTRKVWIDYNIDGDFTDPGELVASEKGAKTVHWTDSFIIPSNVRLGISRMRIGINLAGKKNRACGPNRFGEFEDYRVILSPDITPPVITLNGNDTVVLEVCSSLQGKGVGAVAFDNVDGNVTGLITQTGKVDSNAPGIYRLRYNVKDASGNRAKEVVQTVVILPDATKPEIVLKGKNPDTAAVYQSYTDPGYTASDKCIGLAFDTSYGFVNNYQLGSYKLYYEARDKMGNKIQVIRIVQVVDTVDPVLSLKGGDTVFVKIGRKFMDPGYTVSDNYWKNLRVVKSGSVDVSNPGIYEITYSVTDSSGNGPVEKIRTVIVRGDVDPPVITTESSDTLILDVNEQLIKPVIRVKDNYTSPENITEKAGGTFYEAFPNGVGDSLGIFTLTYSYRDLSGNTSNIKFWVKVEDRIPPEIDLVTGKVVTLSRWETYDNDTFFIRDNFDPAPVMDSLKGNYFDRYLKSYTQGLYEIHYFASDNSGNTGKAIRLVYVTPATGIERSKGFVNQLEVYPNPSRGSYRVDYLLQKVQNVSFSIIDAGGKEVLNKDVSMSRKGSFLVRSNKLKPGNYFILMQTSKEDRVKKIEILK